MGILRNVSSIFITLCNNGIFKSLVYLEPGHIRNQGHIQNSTMECFAKIVKGYNYFRDISFSRFLLYEINIINFLNTGLIFTPQVFILSQSQETDSLETRAELAILRIYVENQAILEPMLLYRVSKCKQTKEQGSNDCLWTHIFTFF